MDINLTSYKRCDVISVKGRVDSSTAPQLGDELNKLMDNSHFHLVLDLEEATFLSSAGLRVLLTTQKNCKRYNRGELVLAAVPANILSALELSGFVPIFRIFDDVVTAVGNI